MAKYWHYNGTSDCVSFDVWPFSRYRSKFYLISVPEKKVAQDFKHLNQTEFIKIFGEPHFKSTQEFLGSSYIVLKYSEYNPYHEKPVCVIKENQVNMFVYFDANTEKIALMSIYLVYGEVWISDKFRKMKDLSPL